MKQAKHQGLSVQALAQIQKDVAQLSQYHESVPADPWEWPSYHHVSGFAHPPIIACHQLDPFKAIVAEWGFVPHWVKTEKEAYLPAKPYNNMLNVQSQTMFDKPAFAKAARYGRCVVLIDGYYESHHYKGRTYPFYIYQKDHQPMFIAAICRKALWVNEDTGEVIQKNVLATLTCEANETLAKIHNNPKMVQRGNGHRMLVILKEKQVADYLAPFPTPLGEKGDALQEESFINEIERICSPYPQKAISYHTVAPLRDRKHMPYPGNVPEIKAPYLWNDFDYTRVGLEKWPDY